MALGWTWSGTRVRGVACHVQMSSWLPLGSSEEASPEEVEQPIRRGAAEGVSGILGYPFKGMWGWVGGVWISVQVSSGWALDGCRGV